jgi:hypothetical protein
MKLEPFKLVTFGPSGAAMPGQEDHRRIVSTFREIELLEGKRPDLLAFDMRAWEQLIDDDRARVLSWSDRLLDARDWQILSLARFGIEVKNSLWHFGRRRDHHAEDDEEGQERLSITVKDEELAKIVGWMEKTHKALLFFQVLFDEIYCMSFSRMAEAMHVGFVYRAGDYLKDGTTGAGGKLYHRFFLSDTRHRCALVRFPNESVAHVEVLKSGSVVPYVELRPAQTYDERPDCVEAEVRIAEQALAKGLPVIGT